MFVLLRAGHPYGFTHSTTEASSMEWTLPFCPLGSSLYPENTGEPGPGSQLPHRQPGVLLAEARQGPFQCPSVQAGHSSQTGGRPGWVAGALPAPGSSGWTPVEQPARHTPGLDPRLLTSFKPLQALVKTSLPLHQHLMGTSMDKDACCQKRILIKCLKFSAGNELI